MLFSRYMFVAILLTPIAALAHSGEALSQSSLLLALAIIIGGACLSWSVRQIGLPAVVGELALGIVIALLAHFNVGFWSEIIHNQSIELLATLGSILLLFEIGLESDFKSFISVGRHGIVVAIIGIILPFVLGGIVVAVWLLGSHDFKLNLFLGATLAATSTGISVRMFKELGILQSKESQIVLAASVIDDILGLVILAVVSGLVVAGMISWLSIGQIILNVVFFFVLAFIIKLVLPYATHWLRRFNREEAALVAVLLAFALLLAWWAEHLGLAAIIGAFVAGLIITHSNKTKLIHSIRPLNYVLVPIFFVYAGMQVDLASITSLNTLFLGLELTIAAIAGKIFCGMFLPKSINRWLVGAGMMPRGEVGLIFALTGQQLGVFDGETFAAVIMMVIITTVITPLALQMLVKRSKKIEG
jgi:Kef-type K+ transport system membrane component KefB